MTEPTSPFTRRTSPKLDYASSIDTALPSSTARAIYHSSFDVISEPRNCDTLVNMNQDIERTPPSILESNCHQLDVDSNRSKIKINYKRFNRTESISLPTTPTEEFSATYANKYESIKGKIGVNEASFSFNSSSNYMTALSEQDLRKQITDESILNSQR